MKAWLLIGLICIAFASHGQSAKKTPKTSNNPHSFSALLAADTILNDQQKYFVSLDSICRLYQTQKITDIRTAVDSLNKMSRETLNTMLYDVTYHDGAIPVETRHKIGPTGLVTFVKQVQPLKIEIRYSVFDEQIPNYFYKCVQQKSLISTLNNLYKKGDMSFGTYYIPGYSGSNYDSDAVPNYGLLNNNLKSQGLYYQMIVEMTSYNYIKAKLLKDGNDLQSYLATEKSSRVPVLALRRQFLSYLHKTYNIQYPLIYTGK